MRNNLSSLWDSRFFRATLIALFAVFFVPGFAGAAFNDAQFDGAGDVALITLSTGTYTVIGATESAEVSASSIILTLAANSSITIYSSGKHTFGITNPDSAVVTFDCLPDQSRLRVVGNGAHTVTVTPTGNSCSNLSQSGGGGGSPPPAPAPAPSPSPASSPSPAPSPAPSPTPSPTPSPAPAPGAVQPPAPSFFRDLQVGSSGEDVRDLQKFLNGKGFVIVPSGPGSPGNETTRFGLLTKKALAAYQTSKGITPSGYFGPKTRAAVEGETAVAPPAPPAAVTPPAGVSLFVSDLALGSKGEEVRLLQVKLNSDPDTRIAESGPGSPGNETGTFGPATRAAVKKFQTKYGLSPVGRVGPATRAKLNELFGGGSGAPATPSPAPAATPSSSEPSAAELQQQLNALLLQLQQLQRQAGQ